MKSTIEYLDALKARLDLPSDYAAAKALNVTRAAVSRYRNGQSVFDEPTAVRVAEYLDLDPLEVISACKAESAADAHMRAVWGTIWGKVTGVTVASALAVGLSVAPSVAESATIQPIVSGLHVM